MNEDGAVACVGGNQPSGEPAVIRRRPARRDEIGVAGEIHRRAYREVVLRQFGEWDDAVQDGFFREDWEGGEFEILECGGEVCGYLAVSQDEACCQIRELAILPEYQGRGMGSALLREIMEGAANAGLPVRLAVLHENGAQRLYRRMGFRVCGRTETHWEMEWRGGWNLDRDG